MKLEGKKILIVEDDNFIADMFVRKLVAEGAECSRATSGTGALQELQKENYEIDLVLTDIMMANMDGYELVVNLNKMDEAKDIPIVVITNRSSLNTENSKITDLNIAGFFIKSNTNLSDLVEEIVKVLASKEAGTV